LLLLGGKRVIETDRELIKWIHFSLLLTQCVKLKQVDDAQEEGSTTTTADDDDDDDDDEEVGPIEWSRSQRPKMLWPVAMI